MKALFLFNISEDLKHHTSENYIKVLVKSTEWEIILELYDFDTTWEKYLFVRASQIISSFESLSKFKNCFLVIKRTAQTKDNHCLSSE